MGVPESSWSLCLYLEYSSQGSVAFSGISESLKVSLVHRTDGVLRVVCSLQGLPSYIIQRGSQQVLRSPSKSLRVYDSIKNPPKSLGVPDSLKSSWESLGFPKSPLKSNKIFRSPWEFGKIGWAGLELLLWSIALKQMQQAQTLLNIGRICLISDPDSHLSCHAYGSPASYPYKSYSSSSGIIIQNEMKGSYRS